jgi:hypothetical protein
MPHNTRTYTNANSLLPADAILVWFGSQVNKNHGQELNRGVGESFYHYFCRWLAIKGLKLEWNVECFPEAHPDKQIICRPISELEPSLGISTL